jgi:monoamine oxidase
MMLAKGLDVRLNTAVEEVRVDHRVQAGPVRADAAIVAVPVALLQAGTPRLPMPSELRRQLDGLVTGNLEKVFLRFPRAWWPDHNVLNVASAPGLRWAQWYNLVHAVGAPVVFGFSGGPSAATRPAADVDVTREAQGVFASAYS